MNTLEHIPVVAPLDGEHALHAVQILPPVVQENAEPVVDEIEVHLTVHGKADARHGVVVVVVAVAVAVLAAHLALGTVVGVSVVVRVGVRVGMARVVALRVLALALSVVRVTVIVRVRVRVRLGLLLDHVLHAVEVEAADAEDKVEVHLRVLGALDGGELVDGAHAVLDGADLSLLDEVSLVHHQTIGERDLLEGLVDDTLGLLLVEVQHCVLGVDEGDHAIEAEGIEKVGLEVESLDDGSGVGKTSSLDQDVVELPLPLVHELAEHVDKVAAHGAAQATVVE